MNELQFYYDTDPDDVHPDMMGDLPKAKTKRTPVLHLDLDSDTVGQIVTVLQPMFETFSSEGSTTIIIAVYACDTVSFNRWKHVWDYIKRNAQDTFDLNAEIKLLLVFVGDTIACSLITEDMKVNKIPENLNIAIPASIVNELTEKDFLNGFDLSKINII